MAQVTATQPIDMLSPEIWSGEVTVTTPTQIVIDNHQGDVIQGSSGSDVLAGFGVDDQCTIRPGSDIVFGGSRNDTLVFDGGGDTVFGESGFDTLIINADRAKGISYNELWLS